MLQILVFTYVCVFGGQGLIWGPCLCSMCIWRLFRIRVSSCVCTCAFGGSLEFVCLPVCVHVHFESRG